MKRPYRILLGISLILGFAGWLSVDEIGRALFERQIEQQVGWDLRDDLEAGLHVGFCGTGSPLPDPGRGGACTFVIAGERVYLFDAGEGAAESMALMGVLPSEVEAVFLTHFHSDHINGLGALALQHVFRGSVSEPLPVYGGPGVERVVNGFNEAYALDHQYRVEHIGKEAAPAEGFELEARPQTLNSSALTTIFEQDGVRIGAFEVSHPSVLPAWGYRVDFGRRSVVISGDTTYTQALVDAARGADLLVHEALAPELVSYIELVARRYNHEGLALVMKSIPGYHASPADAVRAANEAGVTRLALTHLIPGLPNHMFDDLFTAGAEAAFNGDFWVVADGDVVTMPENSRVQYLNVR
ncbi:MAG: MBL fold metallo-hydrolase [Pseudomonadales bacterium]|nr:MBL fold metallo-hydrolase [Pseudomonadales bacterium]